KVNLSDVLSGRVSNNLFRDRIVLIGSVSENTKDFFLSPFSDKKEDGPGRISGVDIHANFTSEMISATLDNRPLLRTFTYWQDAGLVIFFATLGSGVIWRWRSPTKGGIALIISNSIILGSTYLLFTLGWLFPVVPSLLTLIGSAVVATIYLANQAKELGRSREFFHLIIDNIPDPVFVKDTDFKLTVVNEAFCQLINTTESDIIGKTDYDIFTPDEAEIFRHQEASVLETSQATETEEVITNLNGETFAIATKRSLHRDGAGNIFLVGVIRDITERKKLEADLRRTAEELTRSNDELKKSEEHLLRLANHDPLTNLPNRKFFNEKIQQLVKEAQQEEQLVSLLFLDLDGFKPVNDNFGHDMGDVLLKAVAQRIKNCLRATDIVSRLGGDEFTILLPRIKKPLDSSIVAEKILKTVSSPYMLQGNQIQITVSIGISVYPFDNQDTSELIKLADQAMYEAKRSGRNQYKMTPQLEKLVALAPQA
ncbi:MAG: diguanylate cyclase, partial [Limnothrix sp. RL_2_0]|nr:diguanylate cyclase [Limnothrix sp. RL_2_0]